jgi:hypothetical protein
VEVVDGHDLAVAPLHAAGVTIISGHTLLLSTAGTIKCSKSALGPSGPVALDGHLQGSRRRAASDLHRKLDARHGGDQRTLRCHCKRCQATWYSGLSGRRPVAALTLKTSLTWGDARGRPVPGRATANARQISGSSCRGTASNWRA